jgi:polyphosphate kinase 2 (PPK2 family)
VDKVDGLTTAEQCERSYGSIRSFERMLADDRYEIVKFFLHISEAEQHRRLEKRQQDPATRWMVSDEHWRRHAQYAEYLAATESMLENTETARAPWTLVEATDRRWARVKVLETVASRIEAGLARRGSDGVAATSAGA